MSSSPPKQESAQLDLAQRLILILESVRRAAAARASKNWAAAPVVVLLWSYLHRLARRFEALAARLRSARLRSARLRSGRLGSGRIPARSVRPQTSPAPASRRPRLPNGFAWLLRLVPETLPLRGPLEHLLADPELAALLEAAPQAGRILRPLCWMLGIDPSPDTPPALFRPRAAPASAALPRPPSAPGLCPPGLAPPGLAERGLAEPGLAERVEDGVAAPACLPTLA